MHGPATRPTAGRREQVSTRLAFLLLGMSVGAWAPLVPFAKERVGAGDAALGLLLLCLGVGSVLAMPFTPLLVGRFGCRRVILSAGAVLCLAMPFLVLSLSYATLAATLFVFGAAMGSCDVAMNIQAVIVEADSKRPQMSGFHGLWSVGGIAGSGTVSAILWLGGSPTTAVSVAALIIAGLLVLAGPNLLPFGDKASDAPLFVRPRGTVLLMGLLCFAVFLAEGVVLDWGALFLRDRGMEATSAGLGYAAFATAMTVCRLTGDRIVARLGGVRIMRFGGLLAATGFVVVVVSPWPVLGLAGFVLIGIGAANIVPVLFSSTGRQTDMPANHAVGAVTTLGYAGVLLGPAVVGFVASATSLATAFFVVALLMAVVAASARVAR